MKEREEANRRGGKNHIERERGERNKKKKRFSQYSNSQSSTVQEEKSIHAL